MKWFGKDTMMLTLASFMLAVPTLVASDGWNQLQGDARRSGNATTVVLPSPLGLIAAFPTTDAVFAAPVVSQGTAVVIDGSGVVHAIDTRTMEVRWTFKTEGGPGNCNNVAAPAISGDYVHVGTTSGYYYVLNLETGRVVHRLDCGEPIFSAPAVGADRVYFATLGARVYSVRPNGTVCWTWDFVKEVVQFDGDRWSGADWLAARKDRVTWRDHFVCSRDICLVGRTIVVPAGGRTVFLDDREDGPHVRRVATIPAYVGSEYPATFGQSADEKGNLYVQWHRRDNSGRTEILRADVESQVETFVPGSETAIHLPGLMSFTSVSVRGDDVFRVRPERGYGLCRHRLPTAGSDRPGVDVLSEAGSVCPPVLTQGHAIYGGLDGNVHVISLSDGREFSLATAFGAPITAPLAVDRNHVYAGCEDGYLYVFGEDGKAPLPEKNLELWRTRSRLTGPFSESKYDWYTNYGNFSGTNATDQRLRPPLRMRWARRLEGTVKHLPVCGGGRLYTHTAEGQIIAVEQDTGRLLWRRYWPDVYLSFTSPLYVRGKLLVPQGGWKRSMMRCLDAATGRLLWETPFTGSPGWSRQFPPVVQGKIAMYASGSGTYAVQGTEKAFIFKGEPEPDPEGREVMSWIYSNSNPYYPKDSRPRIWAWDVETGKVIWEKDFSKYGRGGNDCGICLLDGKLYYSVFFGFSMSQRKRRGLPVKNYGLTACLKPETGEVVWLTTDYYVTSKCTLSARDGKIFVGGFNPANESTKDRFVWCLDAGDGSLVWQSDPVSSALNAVSVGNNFVFSNALRGKANVFDRKTGRIVDSIGHNYACCRFTLCEPYVLGANMDMIDLSDGGKLVSTGPAVDSRECLGAVVSNGRIFYTSQASGLVVSQTYGPRSSDLPPAWERQ